MREPASKSEQAHINRFLQLVVGIKSLGVSINTDRHKTDTHCTVRSLHNKGGGGVLAKTLEFFISLDICSKTVITVQVIGLFTNFRLKNSDNS